LKVSLLLLQLLLSMCYYCFCVFKDLLQPYGSPQSLNLYPAGGKSPPDNKYLLLLTAY
jgi:hypothetical protein